MTAWRHHRGTCKNASKQRAPRRMQRQPAMTGRFRMPFLAAIGPLVLSPCAGPADAADITVLCPPPMRSVIVELVAGFERASGHHVMITFAPSKAIIERLEAGEKTDVA